MDERQFELTSQYKPTGDQPQAIEKLSSGVLSGRKNQVLLGATGTGKTFTIANIVQKVQKPTLVMAHNKTLAAQLAAEFKEYFPKNSVKYFVSYYDFYQPEAYVPRTDTYIEKQSTINEEIEKYRNAATQSLFTRRDVLIVASVSCIYGLGSASNYENMSFKIKKGGVFDRKRLINRFIDIQYSRNDVELNRGNFRVRGDTVDIYPSYEDFIYRIEYFGNEIESIKKIHPTTGEYLDDLWDLHIFPSRHYVTTQDMLNKRIPFIRDELNERIRFYESKGRELESQRLRQRTNYDLEMLEEVGYCNGIENYSRILDGRESGSPGSCLLDYFPNDYLLVIDESHMTIPQIRGMYFGDQSRKKVLVDHGFRLPSALDNRPLNFTEFLDRVNQSICVSATPSEYELTNALEEFGEIEHKEEKLKKRKQELDIKNLIKNHVEENTNGITLSKQQKKQNIHNTPLQQEKAVTTQKNGKNIKLYNKIITKLKYDDYYITGIAQQIIRPTGLLDPQIFVKPIMGQVKDLETELIKVINKRQRALVITLTKKMSEELSSYLNEQHFKVQYIHSDLDAIERVDVLKALRNGEYDIVVGINLLREGLDLPEVSLVAILDADKEGFLRNQTSLIQTIGRAARHVEGKVILYADYETDSMKYAIEETNRRRTIQQAYNTKHGITPTPITKKIVDQLTRTEPIQKNKQNEKIDKKLIQISKDRNLKTTKDVESLIKDYTNKMKKAADDLEFYKAAEYRDIVKELKKLL